MVVHEVNHVVKNGDVVEGDRAHSLNATFFYVEARVLHYVRALGIYKSDQGLEHLKHVIVAECGINFWPEGKPASEIFGAMFTKFVSNLPYIYLLKKVLWKQFAGKW